MKQLKLVIISIAGLVFGTGLYLGEDWEGVQQPLSFNHKAHSALACVVCHRGVETRAIASIPSPRFCVRCHATAPVTRPEELQQWMDISPEGVVERVGWERLYRIPKHVYFSHRRHVVLAKLDCAVCHGDMAEQTTPPSHPLTAISMDECLDCHEQQGVSTDCASCHK
jgi:hypothetical protein